MDAKEYIREKIRMFDSLRDSHNSELRNCYGVSCSRCHLNRGNCIDNTEESVDIVEKWSKEHPIKTRLTDFLEKHPNAPTYENGCPEVCCAYIGYERKPDCIGSNCVDCWNRPLEEVE